MTPTPRIRIRAKRLTIIPGKSIEAEKPIYAGQVPVMYLPLFTPAGAASQLFCVHTRIPESYGPYLLGSYPGTGAPIERALNLDFRQKRGLGFGPDLEYDFAVWARGRCLLLHA